MPLDILAAFAVADLRKNNPVIAEINAEKRQATALNHSATHLMHAALKSILGSHVEQKGSLVTDQYLRLIFRISAQLAEGYQAYRRTGE